MTDTHGALIETFHITSQRESTYKKKHGRVIRKTRDISSKLMNLRDRSREFETRTANFTPTFFLGDTVDMSFYFCYSLTVKKDRRLRQLCFLKRKHLHLLQPTVSSLLNVAAFL